MFQYDVFYFMQEDLYCFDFFLIQVCVEFVWYVDYIFVGVYSCVGCIDLFIVFDYIEMNIVMFEVRDYFFCFFIFK